MIPIRDVNPTRRTPVVTIFLIGMNVSVFLIAAPLFTADLGGFAVTPKEVLDCQNCGLWRVWRSIFNAMFLHIGLIHIAGNMFTLWLFANNVEDKLGRIRFVLFYLATGLAATYFYVFLNPDSTDALVGASGAIAGCIGAYLLMFPKAYVTTLSISFGGRRELRKMMNEGPAGATKSRLISIAAVDIPAWVFAGFYFVLQLSQNVLGWVEKGPAIAYESHIGGFVGGMLALLVLAPREIHPSIRRLFVRGARMEEPASVESADATGRRQSITHGWRALELFTDRDDAVRLFAGYLNDDPPRGSILFFHGDGGNGKSLLLRHLAERCTKRFPPERWDEIGAAPAGEAASSIAAAGSGGPVPYALLDFGAQPRGDDRPQEAFAGLLMLRRALADSLRAFPLFDFACVQYLTATGNASPERLRLLFPNEERNFIASVADVVADQHWVADAAMEMITRRIGTSFDAYFKRRKLGPESLEAIERMDPRTELIDELPRLFAQDLNAAMGLPGSPARLVLFFDGHESFWGDRRGVSEYLFFERDEWVRRLLGELDLAAGIVCVVAGREPAAWPRAMEARIPESSLDMRLLGHFSDADAETYLERAGVEDPAMRAQLAEHARVEGAQVHPLYLGLCADLVLAAASAGSPLSPPDFAGASAAADEGRKLVARLLRFVEPEVAFAVRALSAARAFDREIYDALGKALGFRADDASFELLTGLSFVWRTDQSRYRVHPLLRRLGRQRDDEAVRRADAALEAYYRERSDDVAARAEAVYHASMGSPRRGVGEWLELFADALVLNRFDLCRTLLDVRKELAQDDDAASGGAARLAGDYFARLARYGEAKSEYENAVAAYDRAVAAETSVPDHYRRKGDVLRRLCELQARYSRHEEALDSYRRAIAAYADGLAVAPDDIRIRKSRANAMRALGDIQVRLSRNDDALATYEAAAAASDEVLHHAPGDPSALNQRGVLFRSLGELHAIRGDVDASLEAYRRAIDALEQVLERSPDNVEALNNAGIAYRSVGDLHVSAGDDAEAEAGYARAIDAYDRALIAAPDYLYAHNNRGTALRSLGALQASRSRHEEALETYDRAVAAYDEALRLGPDYVYAHNNRGSALSMRAESLLALSRDREAIDELAQAVASFDAALRLAPDYVHAQTNRGIARRRVGDLFTSAGETERARASYLDAAAAFDRALEIAPDNEAARAQKAAVQAMLDAAGSPAG